MEILDFVMSNPDLLGKLTLEHIGLVIVAVGLATLTGVPIGIAITQNERLATVVLYTA